ncbi:hypothetical protein [Billgrantia antri]|uniref:Uncharacterized protein n=1 Tax=Billgrantia antri TaxID=2846777 RepID=A0ABS6ZKR6_9GAMM|nr:hypothetical protein [Halomonas antri]MBW6390656.1 hypothetical protein [Halomonas antri]
MTQTYHAAARYDDEVLRFWAAQASDLQAAQESLWQYFERPLTTPAAEISHEQD